MIALALLPALCSGAAGWLLVTNEASNDIAIVDEAGGDLVGRIDVGKRPRGIRVMPGGKLAYVAVSGSPRGGPGVDESKLPPPDRSADGIAIVDLVSRRVLRTLPSGPDPETFDVSPDGNELFVANEDAATVSFVDARSGAIDATVAVGAEPEGVTLHPNGRVVYVTSEQTGTVSVIDVKRRKVIATIKTAARPRNVVFTRDGKKAYATCEAGAAVTVIDAAAHRVLKTLKLPGLLSRPMGAALDGTTLWVTLGRGGAVASIDTTTDEVKAVLEGVGTRPWGIVASAGRLFTANGPSGDVSVIDPGSGAVLQRIATGDGPWGIARTEPPRRQLRVCADPNNLPFSSRDARGFENELAELVARELQADLTYTWWPQRRGFLKNTLKANRCDVVMGVPSALDTVKTTRPYYRSSYALVLGPRARDVRSLADARLENLRIGVPLAGDDGAAPAPVFVLAQRGLTGHLHGYTATGDYRVDSPAAELVRGVGRGEVDLSIAWGPLAGYYAARMSPPLTVRMLDDAFGFDISMGVRRGDEALARELDQVLERRKSDVDAILAAFDVPRQ